MVYKPSLSLVIAVYNKPDVLRFVLATCNRQSFKDFEIIVADDGSGPEVREVVEESRVLYGFPIIHLWQEDMGWRKDKMLNSAIRSSSSEYLVFVDGDCLLGKDFLLDHWNQRESNRILFGRRVQMSERWFKTLTLAKVMSGEYEKIGMRELIDGLKGDTTYLETGIRIKNKLLRKFLFRNSIAMLGSNFSVHKKDMVTINGFDETYDEPGLGEDTDVEFRLSLIGVIGKSLRNLALQFHVHHPPPKWSLKSIKRLDAVKAAKNPRCMIGLDDSRELARVR